MGVKEMVYEFQPVPTFKRSGPMEKASNPADSCRCPAAFATVNDFPPRGALDHEGSVLKQKVPSSFGFRIDHGVIPWKPVVSRPSTFGMPQAEFEGMRTTGDEGGPRIQPVRIQYHDRLARNVAVAASFNRWRPSPLVHVGFGWWLRIFFLAPGSYDFRLIVEGQSGDGSTGGVRGQNCWPVESIAVRETGDGRRLATTLIRIARPESVSSPEVREQGLPETALCWISTRNKKPGIGGR